MRSKLKTIIFVLVTLAVSSNVALAVEEKAALVNLNVTTAVKGWYMSSRTVGWTFTVNGTAPGDNISVIRLGTYDHLGDGLGSNHPIGLWDSSGTLLVDATIPAGSGSVLDGGYRYVDIAPIELQAGQTYTIGVLVGGESTLDYMITKGSASADAAITIVPNEYGLQSLYNEGGTLAKPSVGLIDEQGFNANFQFTTAPTNQSPTANDDTAETELATPVTINVLANDLDPDGDPLSIDSVGAPANGTATKNDDDTVTYTPNANFVGTDTFSYTISDGNGGTATATVTITVNPGTVEIDIKPGSYPNTINLGSNGVVPVGIISSEGFDATAVAPENVFLAGSGVAIRGKGNKYLAHEEDVNGDGLMDLVVQVETENLDPGEFQDGYAVLKIHQTSDQNSPVLYQGSDEITIVPPE